MPKRFEPKKKDLISLIIPAYMQEKTIEMDIVKIKNVLDQTRYEYEIIIVVDGFDDKTYQQAKKIVSDKINVFGYAKNRGKGYAIRFGMKHANGSIIGFIDSGMDLNPNGLSMLLEHFEWYNADIIVGSKRHPVSKVTYPWTRRFISLLGQLWIGLLFGLRVRDTQVGMKFFKRKVIQDVLPRLLVKRFAFDIEILAVANHLGYTKIFEAPVDIDFNFKSTVSQKLLNAVFHTFWDTLAIFYRLRILHFYDDRGKWEQLQKAEDSI